MPTPVSQIVNINISLSALGITQAGFGIPLVVGPNGFNNSDVIRYYTSPTAYLQDGHTTSDIEYTYLQEAFDQPLQPTSVGVGKRLPAMNAIDTIMVNTLTASHLYAFTLNGVVVSYTSTGLDTQQSILGQLATQVDAITGPFGTFSAPFNGVVTGTGSGATLTITSAGGYAATYTAVDSQLTHAQSQAAYNIKTDLAAIIAAPTGNNWYGLAIASGSDFDVLNAASFIQPLQKIFIGTSGDGAIATSATNDLASVLQGFAYTRTALMYSPGSYNLGIDAAWLGGQLPQVAGSNNWAFKTLVGILPDSYTATQRATLIGQVSNGVQVNVGKGVNIYESVGGVNITEFGWMVGGQFIDVTVGIDALQANMQALIFAQLVNNPKVPYTDKGIAIIENQVNAALQAASDNPGGSGFLDHTTIVVTALSASSISASQKATRILPPGIITFSAQLTGALNNITINGTVTA